MGDVPNSKLNWLLFCLYQHTLDKKYKYFVKIGKNAKNQLRFLAVNIILKHAYKFFFQKSSVSHLYMNLNILFKNEKLCGCVIYSGIKRIKKVYYKIVNLKKCYCVYMYCLFLYIKIMLIVCVFLIFLINRDAVYFSYFPYFLMLWRIIFFTK